MVHLPIGLLLCGTFSMLISQDGGLGRMDQFRGHLAHRILLHWIFFLWGYIKDCVYRTRVQNSRDLKERVTEAMHTVTREMLSNTWRELEYRFNILRATKGAHVEIY